MSIVLPCYLRGINQRFLKAKVTVLGGQKIVNAEKKGYFEDNERKLHWGVIAIVDDSSKKAYVGSAGDEYVQTARGFAAISIMKVIAYSEGSEKAAVKTAASLNDAWSAFDADGADASAVANYEMIGFPSAIDRAFSDENAMGPTLVIKITAIDAPNQLTVEVLSLNTQVVAKLFIDITGKEWKLAGAELYGQN